MKNTPTKLSSLILLAGLGTVHAAPETIFDGDLYTRFSTSYQTADDYYAGSGSFASFVFDAGEGEYTFINYNLDLAYSLPHGFYVASGAYATDAKVESNGLGLGVPNTDSGFELREIPLALGYASTIGGISTKFEIKYTFNEDDDFNRPSVGAAVQDEVLLPVTDGSDYWSFSSQVGATLAGFKHKLGVQYQIFEEDAEHPLFPEYTLGDRFSLDYEIAYEFEGGLQVYLGHLFVWSDETEGDSSGSFLEGVFGVGNAPVYVYEQPRYQSIRAGVKHQATDRLLLELGGSYFYDGSDAPKQTSIFTAIAYTF